MCAFNDMFENWIALIVAAIAVASAVRMIWDQPAPPDAGENMKRAIAFAVGAGALWFAFFNEFGESKLASANRGYSSAISGLDATCAESPGFPFVMTFAAAVMTIAFLFYLARSLKPEDN